MLAEYSYDWLENFVEFSWIGTQSQKVESGIDRPDLLLCKTGTFDLNWTLEYVKCIPYVDPSGLTAVLIKDCVFILTLGTLMFLLSADRSITGCRSPVFYALDITGCQT